MCKKPDIGCLFTTTPLVDSGADCKRTKSGKGKEKQF